VGDLYRVFPFLSRAGPGEPGGALYLPPSQGGGRLNNPDLYSVFYASSTEAGAVAEAFGRFPEWTPAILEGSPSLPGSSGAIAHYRLAETAPICDLDDPTQLVSLGLRPSEVVSRDYARTREWAARIHRQGGWVGVRWWSYYDPRWSSFGLWDLAGVSLLHVRTLRLDDAAILEAAHVICRQISRHSAS
jgi:hypothetical protein